MPNSIEASLSEFERDNFKSGIHNRRGSERWLRFGPRSQTGLKFTRVILATVILSSLLVIACSFTGDSQASIPSPSPEKTALVVGTPTQTATREVIPTAQVKTPKTSATITQTPTAKAIETPTIEPTSTERPSPTALPSATLKPTATEKPKPTAIPTPTFMPLENYYDLLLKEINKRRQLSGTKPVVYVSDEANKAVSQYLADLTPEMLASNKCFHGEGNPVSPSWDYVAKIGYKGQAGVRF